MAAPKMKQLPVWPCVVAAMQHAKDTRPGWQPPTEEQLERLADAPADKALWADVYTSWMRVMNPVPGDDVASLQASLMHRNLDRTFSFGAVKLLCGYLLSKCSDVCFNELTNIVVQPNLFPEDAS